MDNPAQFDAAALTFFGNSEGIIEREEPAHTLCLKLEFKL